MNLPGPGSELGSGVRVGVGVRARVRFRVRTRVSVRVTIGSIFYTLIGISGAFLGRVRSGKQRLPPQIGARA